MKGEKTLDLSWGTIFKIGALLFLIYILYLIKEILILVLFAFILSFLIEPAISFFEKKKIPRPTSVFFIYFLLFFSLGTLIFFFVSPIFSESQKLIKSIPDYFEKISPTLKNFGILASENFEDFLKTFQDWLIKASKSIFSAIFAIFGGIFSTLTVFFLSIFISLEKEFGERMIRFFSPKEKEEEFLEIFKKCQTKVSAWFGSRILGCLFVFFLTLLSLKVFKIDYAFSLSFLSGFFEIIPILGPLISGILIFLVSFLNSLKKAFFALLAFVLIQQIESNVLSPILTKKFVGLSPVLTFISFLIGGKILGFWGAVFSIPLAAMVLEVAKEVFKKEI
jgi:predicted PurR-regulated permease PerM